MPWTAKDVDRFKKGLSQEKKKKWVSIANSVLRECQSNNEGNCEQKAIRTANSRVNANKMETEKFIVQSTASLDYEIRTETHQGKEHIVVPVVMMVEGVHNGSRGPLLHTAQELGHIVDSWNGIPVVIDHPQDSAGNYVSANSPQVVDQAVVGRVYNSYMDGQKLKGEAWLDASKLRAASPEAEQAIRQKQPVDVSVGVFNDEEDTEGEWNGEVYTAVARNHRPDHLALLPGAQGACSWSDGCGVRVNKELSETLNLNVNEMSKKEEFKVFKDLNGQGLAVIPMQVNQEGMMELLGKVRQKLDSMDTDYKMYFLEELYDDSVIYRVRNMEADTTTLYKVNYQINGDGKVEFNGDPAEVRRNITYETAMRRTKFNNNKNKSGMEVNADVKKKVDELIANTNSKFTNCDREWLEGQSLEQLKSLEPKREEPQETKLDANKAFEVLKENKPNKEQILELLSEEDKQAFNQGIKLYQEKRQKMVDTITNNTDAWKKEELEKMDFETLEKVAKTVKPAADYSGQNAGGQIETNTEQEEGVLLPPGVEPKK